MHSSPMLGAESEIYTVRREAVQTYAVHLVEDVLAEGNTTIPEVVGHRAALVVTTPTVDRLYGERLRTSIRRYTLQADVIVLTCSEDAKTSDLVLRVCAEANARGLDRKGLLVGFGGGVCTDIVTVAASWIRRGIQYVRIPTTLIGQIDAGIGVKGAFNVFGKKSYLGCFYPPETVVIDPTLLGTVDPRHLRQGIAEMIKIAIVRDHELFDLIAVHHKDLIEARFREPPGVVRRTIVLAARRMLDELQANLYEDRTFRRLVDFGHTFSPLLEAESSFQLGHGDAVAVDMAFTVRLAAHLGYLATEDADAIVRTLGAAGLPVWSPMLTRALCRQALAEATRHRGGRLHLVMPTSIGSATFIEHADEVPVSAIDAALAATGRYGSDHACSHGHGA